MKVLVLVAFSVFGMALGTGTDDKSSEYEAILDNLESGECSPCVETLLGDLLTCAVDNTCDLRGCIETYGNDIENLIGNCCPDCSTIINGTVTCFTGCLPPCVEVTTSEYAKCLAANSVGLGFNQVSCGDSCQAALELYTNNIDEGSEILQIVEGTVDGEDITIQVVLDFVEEQSGMNISSALTCENLEDQLSEDVCELANCCEYCIDEFEAVAECAINDIINQQILQNDVECDVECGTSKTRGPSLPNRPNNRLLQPKNDNELFANSGPSFGEFPDNPFQLDDQNRPQIFSYLYNCRKLLAANIALGANDVAFESYMECILEILYNSVPQKLEINAPTPSPTSEAPTGSSTSGNGTDTMGAYNYGTWITLTMIFAFTVMLGWA